MTAQFEHFELAQGWRSSLPEAVASDDGHIREPHRTRFAASEPVGDYAEFDRTKFMRLSSESFPDLEGRQLEVLRDLCHAAHPSEEFFLTVATNQWLRTAIKSDRASEELFSLTLIEEERHRMISDIIIHSNVLPYHPYWTMPRVMRDGAGCLASKRVHFPCFILKEALTEGKTLMKKLYEWQGECEIGKHEQDSTEDGNIEQQKTSKFLWEVLADVVTGKHLKVGGEATIWPVTWRRGKFIRKDHRFQSTFEAELNVVERLCHPHIVYVFGLFCDGKQSSLYMEYLQNDLLSVILENVRLEELQPDAETGMNQESNAREVYTDGNMSPPFLHQDLVDILLQVAKAMTHMHERSVVHGDLKSENILISKFEISENRYHYLAKVADFGSARVLDTTAFKPANGTTLYAAPEVLKFRRNKIEVISFPQKIDVFSFGIVAFEVFTGEKLYRNKSTLEVKEGIIDGTLRPPLRAVCGKDNFLHDEGLISLIEACWHKDPSERPSFSKIVEVLDRVRTLILEVPPSRSEQCSPGRGNNSVSNTFGALEEAASGSNDHHSLRPVQVITSDALDCQGRRSSRRRTSLWKLRPFSCVASGKDKS